MEYLHNLPMNKENGVILRRKGGDIETNVPWLLRHHSPTGFEWGYEGSGPADLALNILEVVLLMCGYKGPKTDGLFEGGSCLSIAFALHQNFKREFIAKIPQEGGTIDLMNIVRWIEQNAPGFDYPVDYLASRI